MPNVDFFGSLDKKREPVRRKPARAQKEVKTVKTKKKQMHGGAVSTIGAESSDFGGVWLSVTAFCRESGKDRAFMAKRLANAPDIRGIKSDKGNIIYRLASLIDLAYLRDESGKNNIDRMDPFRKKAHYDSEVQKRKLEQIEGSLIPREMVETRISMVMKNIAQFLDTLPDVLERDCGLPANAIVVTQQRIDVARTELRKQIVDESLEQETTPLEMEPEENDLRESA